MAAYNKFDPRVDSLVVETRTNWAPDVVGLSEEDKTWLAKAIHADPKLAGKISYERMHTGFAREITVTTADIERLYASRFGIEPAAV
jgi:predicted metal-dependent RNase